MDSNQVTAICAVAALLWNVAGFVIVWQQKAAILQLRLDFRDEYRTCQECDRIHGIPGFRGVNV